MLKKRVIGVVLVKDGVAVQSIGFRRYLPIGKPHVAIEYLDRWGIDEIVVLHVHAAGPADAQTVAGYARRCRVPLAVGGGIRDAGAVKRVIQAGADKAVLNTAAITHPGLITEAASLFGEQCVVVSIDAKRRSGGMHEAFVECGRRGTGLSPAELAARAASLGAGEILANSIDRDGIKQGYDLELLRAVAAAVSIPVIACGGAGHPEHMRAALACGTAAVAAGNFFHFVEHSVILVKRQLAQAGEPVRIDSYANYEGRAFSDDGRLAKQSDAALDALRFRYVPEEVI